jgi:molecular chaperone HtpG
MEIEDRLLTGCPDEGGDADESDARLPDYAGLLYGQAILAEGGQLTDPAAFTKKLTDLMVNAL